MLKHLDLFSGIGGFSLGLESAGLVETVAFCDFDKYCQQVLNKNFLGVPVYGDVKELNYEKLKADGIDQVDIITGGYPCQPFSVAGRKKGEQDPRHVWPEMFRLIKELRPTWVIGENVGGHIKLGLDSVLENLESEGYSARTFSISASSVGANHQRERVWILAYSERNGLLTTEKQRSFEKTISNQSKGKNDTFNVERTSSVSETKSDVENSRRSIGREQPPRNSKGIGRWSFETSEWSTDTDQIARPSDGAETVADSDEMQRQLLRGQQSEQRQETFEGASNGSGTSNDFSDSESIVSDGGEYREHSEKRKAEGQTRREGCLDCDATNSNSSRLEEQWRSFTTEQENQASQCGRWWDIEPDVGRVAHGVPKRVDRLKCLGNSVVPQIPFVIGLAIKETIENE
jgi:DNA (cytosine-5)-methyltransferase 1